MKDITTRPNPANPTPTTPKAAASPVADYDDAVTLATNEAVTEFLTNFALNQPGAQASFRSEKLKAEIGKLSRGYWPHQSV